MAALVLEMVNVRPFIESIALFIIWLGSCVLALRVPLQCLDISSREESSGIHLSCFTESLMTIHTRHAVVHVLATNVFILYRHKPGDRTRQPLRAMSRNLVLKEIDDRQ